MLVGGSRENSPTEFSTAMKEAGANNDASEILTTPPKAQIEKIKVLTSVERISQIIVKAAAVVPISRPRTRAVMAARNQHPAVRTSISSTDQFSPSRPDGTVSAEVSPLVRKNASSPLTKPAGVTKAPASTPPATRARGFGLQAKSGNTKMVIQKVLDEGHEGKKEKKVTVQKKAAAKSTNEPKAKPASKQPKKKAAPKKQAKPAFRNASSSLKRAAGIITAKAGLTDIGRMR